jgi:hypothetical protein
MAETHLLMHVAAFVGALWWTKHWMLDPVGQRWRFILSSLASVPLWIVVAFTATRAVSGSSGVGIVYGSLPIAYFGGLMAALSLLGFVLGLFLWTEEEGERAAQSLPENVRGQFGD